MSSTFNKLIKFNNYGKLEFCALKQKKNEQKPEKQTTSTKPELNCHVGTR